MSETKLFEGYGPYRIDEAGVPFLNDVVWDFLEKRAISAEEFGKRFGKLTRKTKQPYTKSRIYQMLRDNAFPDDKTRRWVLAKLLQIPPILLGVKSLDDLLFLQEPARKIQPASSAVPVFDPAEYRFTLSSYWKRHRFLLSVDLETDVANRIAVLEQQYLYGPTEAKRSTATLLCGYHMLSSNMATDQRNFDNAIVHLNKAYAVAKERKLAKLEGACLLRRGWALKERGEEKGMEHDFDAALVDFTHASSDFMLAFREVKRLPNAMQGSLLLSIGKLNADTAKNPQEFHLAIKKIEEAEGFVGKSVDEEDIHFIQLDEERYYLDRAAAYLASSNPLFCYPRDARKELRHAISVAPTPLPKRRHAYNMVLEAKSYAVEGHASLARKRTAQADDCFSAATRKATEAILLVRDIDSQVNVARIEKLCADLQATPYGKGNVDLAGLEVEIATAKYPQMFQ